MALLLATSISLLTYQNCSPATQIENSTSSKNAIYSSSIGLGGGAGGAGGVFGGSAGTVGGAGGMYAPGMVGGSGTGGGIAGGVMPIIAGGGANNGGGGSSGGNAGGNGSGAIPVGGGAGGNGASGSGATGGGSPGGIVGGANTGVNPGGSTGGAALTDSLMWQYQPEDRTVEEGEILTLGAYATKGVDVVTYQWYRNDVPISGQTGYIFRQFQVPRAVAGRYFVEARSGNSSIRSLTVTVNVKAARNPCLAGGYGHSPGTRNYNEYFHESIISARYAPHKLQSELPDSYTVRLPHANPSAAGGNCVAASALFQCRNGMLISIDALRCDQSVDGY